MPTRRPELASLHDLKDFFEVLVRGWRLILITILICMTAPTVYIVRARRIYHASTRLLILQHEGRPLNVAGNDPARPMEESNVDYIPTQALIIISPAVVKPAIDKIGLQNLPSLSSAEGTGRTSVEEALAMMKVTRPDRLARIISVTYSAWSPEEATRMLTAITESYKHFLENAYHNRNNETVALIVRARDDVSRELDDLEAKYLQYRRQAPYLIDNETARSSIALRLERTNHEVKEVEVKALKLRYQLGLAKQLASGGAELWAVAHAISLLGGDSISLNTAIGAGVASGGAADYIRQLMIEQQQLAERYGPDNVKVEELQTQIARIQERTRATRGRLGEAEVRSLLDAVAEGLKSTESMKNDLTEQLKREEDEAKQFEIDLLTGKTLRAKVDRHRALFNTVLDQLKQAQFVSDFEDVSTQTIEAPRLQRKADHPRVGLLLGLALAIGGNMGVVLAYVADRLDQRIRSPKQLREALGIPVLGQIANARADRAILNEEFGLIARIRPNSAWAESYKSIRTHLEFLRRNRRLRVLQVSSPYSGDGKSVSASNMAICGALIGRKILLIDGDLRHPSQHKIHEVSNDRGLTDLLNGRLETSQVVQRTSVENLDLICAGPDVDGPSELLTSNRLTELFEELGRDYDTIIVDSSPLLAVTDPAIIGAAVDGVILIVRAYKLKIHDAEAVVEWIDSLGTPSLGTIFNAIDAKDFGYGYHRGQGHRDGHGASGDGTRVLKANRDGPASDAEFGKTSANGREGTNDYRKGLFPKGNDLPPSPNPLFAGKYAGDQEHSLLIWNLINDQ